MGATLYSRILKVNDDELDKIKIYCQEHELKLTINVRDKADFRYWIVVWGTKRELTEFSEWF